MATSQSPPRTAAPYSCIEHALAVINRRDVHFLPSGDRPFARREFFGERAAR